MPTIEPSPPDRMPIGSAGRTGPPYRSGLDGDGGGPPPGEAADASARLATRPASARAMALLCQTFVSLSYNDI